MSTATAPRTARIAPGTRDDIGRLNALVVGALGLAVGGAPPHVFRTLARHRGLFVPWLRFAGRLMPGGKLPRTDSELVILRVAHNCRCAYERAHHEHLGARAGLSADQIAATAAAGDPAGVLGERQRLLLAAADQLHGTCDLSDELWARLDDELSDVELIELCMLVGHYEMLAMTLNALRVQPDPPPDGPPSPLARAVRTLAERRGGRR